jgi:hypothetical protein
MLNPPDRNTAHACLILRVLDHAQGKKHVFHHSNQRNSGGIPFAMLPKQGNWENQISG